ncbi:IclR family transcriptional regulator domain-containing protein [Streptomyces stelliscabiei]|uniref:IclR family pca regulon transcriptional regulator n=1 Tax=Streptomyces stelliscabiei TaxID=146820 RepID=A0A8I0PFR7_9ACTN|nr:IclR family transcriptional regulator C-terminal domain-containing protein [Streptomyces stelliscabiei]KND44741.1 IclR family transcriptional regulator [Streptomyces stelliscabiei]MBE1601515.1 IclR family pca regulon transcriptional regulator [Streptomyces stelliscabiei]MDX2515164.1 IclR family transcriptional regulator C-terminal domain-containing protein [Streptomyces stelliscabiei]MDX2555279.1 IclR family transcriptional regulator C-terminal domain-containing protein [Streptomyces stellis
MPDRDRFGAARRPHFVRSFERGLAVVRAFDAEHPARTLSEVARACELTRAAARRFLLTLVDLGYVHTDGRLFRLTPRVLELGYAYLSSVTLPDLAVPHLERLVAQVGESSSLCVLDGDDIVYVARVGVRRIMTATITVGTRLPAHVTSVGRVLLAHLPDEETDARLARADLGPLTRRTLTSADRLRTELRRVRRQGYAVVDQELEEGLRSVAAPVRDRHGEVVAGVNIPVHAGRTSVASVRRDLLPHLLATAARIEADLCVTGTATGRARAGAVPLQVEHQP